MLSVSPFTNSSIVPFLPEKPHQVELTKPTLNDLSFKDSTGHTVAELISIQQDHIMRELSVTNSSIDCDKLTSYSLEPFISCDPLSHLRTGFTDAQFSDYLESKFPDLLSGSGEFSQYCSPISHDENPYCADLWWSFDLCLEQSSFDGSSAYYIFDTPLPGSQVDTAAKSSFILRYLSTVSIAENIEGFNICNTTQIDHLFDHHEAIPNYANRTEMTALVATTKNALELAIQDVNQTHEENLQLLQTYLQGQIEFNRGNISVLSDDATQFQLQTQNKFIDLNQSFTTADELLQTQIETNRGNISSILTIDLPTLWNAIQNESFSRNQSHHQLLTTMTGLNDDTQAYLNTLNSTVFRHFDLSNSEFSTLYTLVSLLNSTLRHSDSLLQGQIEFNRGNISVLSNEASQFQLQTQNKFIALNQSLDTAVQGLQFQLNLQDGNISSILTIDLPTLWNAIHNESFSRNQSHHQLLATMTGLNDDTQAYLSTLNSTVFRHFDLSNSEFSTLYALVSLLNSTLRHSDSLLQGQIDFNRGNISVLSNEASQFQLQTQSSFDSLNHSLISSMNKLQLYVNETYVYALSLGIDLQSLNQSFGLSFNNLGLTLQRQISWNHDNITTIFTIEIPLLWNKLNKLEDDVFNNIGSLISEAVADTEVATQLINDLAAQTSHDIQVNKNATIKLRQDLSQVEDMSRTTSGAVANLSIVVDDFYFEYESTVDGIYNNMSELIVEAFSSSDTTAKALEAMGNTLQVQIDGNSRNISQIFNKELPSLWFKLHNETFDRMQEDRSLSEQLAVLQKLLNDTHAYALILGIDLRTINSSLTAHIYSSETSLQHQITVNADNISEIVYTKIPELQDEFSKETEAIDINQKLLWNAFHNETHNRTQNDHELQVQIEENKRNISDEIKPEITHLEEDIKTEKKERKENVSTLEGDIQRLRLALDNLQEYTDTAIAETVETVNNIVPEDGEEKLVPNADATKTLQNNVATIEELGSPEVIEFQRWLDIILTSNELLGYAWRIFAYLCLVSGMGIIQSFRYHRSNEKKALQETQSGCTGPLGPSLEDYIVGIETNMLRGTFTIDDQLSILEKLARIQNIKGEPLNLFTSRFELAELKKSIVSLQEQTLIGIVRELDHEDDIKQRLSIYNAYQQWRRPSTIRMLTYSVLRAYIKHENERQATLIPEHETWKTRKMFRTQLHDAWNEFKQGDITIDPQDILDQLPRRKEIIQKIHAEFDLKTQPSFSKYLHKAHTKLLLLDAIPSMIHDLCAIKSSKKDIKTYDFEYFCEQVAPTHFPSLNLITLDTIIDKGPVLIEEFREICNKTNDISSFLTSEKDTTSSNYYGFQKTAKDVEHYIRDPQLKFREELAVRLEAAMMWLYKTTESALPLVNIWMDHYSEIAEFAEQPLQNLLMEMKKHISLLYDEVNVYEQKRATVLNSLSTEPGLPGVVDLIVLINNLHGERQRLSTPPERTTSSKVVPLNPDTHEDEKIEVPRKRGPRRFSTLLGVDEKDLQRLRQQQLVPIESDSSSSSDSSSGSSSDSDSQSGKESLPTSLKNVMISARESTQPTESEVQRMLKSFWSSDSDDDSWTSQNIDDFFYFCSNASASEYFRNSLTSSPPVTIPSLSSSLRITQVENETLTDDHVTTS